MTKDMKKVFLNIPNSYNSSKKASIDFCCSGHTSQKRCEVWDSKVSDSVEGTEAYILFEELYNIPGQEVLHGCSRLGKISCGTLIGIKKACRKLYRIAQKLPNINSLSRGIEL